MPLSVRANVDRIEAHPSSPCATVLSVPWRFLQGWRGTVDGSDADVVAVNSLTLGVVLPPGDHDVVFAWRPPGARGVPVAAATAVGVGLLVAADALRRRRRPSTTP